MLSVEVKEQNNKEADSMKNNDGNEIDLSTVNSMTTVNPGTDCNVIETESLIDINKKELEIDHELICIDFFLRYLSYLFPLWAEYADNLMFHITQVYGALSKEEYIPYIRILESLGLEINKNINTGLQVSADEGFEIGDSLSYPLDIEKCDTQTCIRAISHLDSYREWIDCMLINSSGKFEGLSQISRNMKEGELGRPITEWKLMEITNDLVLPLVYQAYVTFDIKEDGPDDKVRENEVSTNNELSGSANSNKNSVSICSPLKSNNEVGVTYEKNRDRWVAVWTENGIRRSRIFNVKQYGYDTAREMAIQYRKEQLANALNKISSTGSVSTNKNNKRSRKSLDSTGRSSRGSPSTYNTRNSGLESICLQNTDYEVFFDQERDAWICKNSVNEFETETIFSIDEFGAEKARQMAIDKAGGQVEEITQTPVKRTSIRSNSTKAAGNTPKKRDSLSSSSSFRIRIANNGSGLKSEATSNGTQMPLELTSTRGDSKRSSTNDEFLVYHGKKYYFGPVIEGIRYDKIQNRWVTGYVGQDGRKRYKYFSIGAYGFEGSRQLAIEYRESMYSSTKGVDKLSEFLQTVIQGFPSFEDGILQDVSFEDLIIHKGQIKGGAEGYYLCVPSKGDFLVTTPVDEKDELTNNLINKYKSILENNGGRENQFFKETNQNSNNDSKDQDLVSLSNAASQNTKVIDSSIITENSKIDTCEQDFSLNKIESFSDSVFEQTSEIKQNSMTDSTSEDNGMETKNLTIDHEQYKMEDKVECRNPLESNRRDTLEINSDSKEHLEFQSSPISKGSHSSLSSSSMNDDLVSSCDSSLFIETEDKTTPNSRKRFFIGPKIDGVFYNPTTHRWVSQYELDGIQLTKNFSAKSYGFEKSRYMAIQWRIKHHGEPPQLNQLIQALKHQGIDYPPQK